MAPWPRPPPRAPGPAPGPDSLPRLTYLAALLFAALLTRGLVGGFRPELGPGSSAIIGLATVVCLAPTLHRMCFGAELLDTPGKRRRHLLAMGLAGWLYWQAVS